MKMWVYIIRRALLLVPVIIGVMTITFVIVSQMPTSTRLLSYFGPSKTGYQPTVPCSQLNPMLNGTCSNPTYARDVHILGLDRPLPVQWGIYLYNSLTLNWGTTDPHSAASTHFALTGAAPVTTVLSYFLPYTLELAAISLFLILVLAIPIGNYSAVYRNRPLDQGARVLSFSGFALPGFLLASGLLLLATTASGSGLECNNLSFHYYDWVGSWPPLACWPGGDYPSWIGPYLETSPTGFPTADALIHGNFYMAGQSVYRLLLPALTIAYGAVAVVLRFVRNSMLEVMNLDFIRTARAKGVAESTVIRRHAGRNSLNVTVTVLGLTFASFIGGFPVVELVFGLRGVGLLLAYSIQPSYDFGLIFGTTLLFTIIVVLANIIVDILYAYLDPRVRLG
ncbi:MAG: ABC transporter permease [Thermoplasmata archaeon]